ncbi:MAG: hypothetical protein HYR85_02150 [Planctomycetes bacterium]|nr:hypothetical protein [Planctomycetota bacterium]
MSRFLASAAIALAPINILAARALAQPLPCPTTFFDGEFNVGDWEEIVFHVDGNGGTASSTQELSGGNPDRYRRVVHSINPAQSPGTPDTCLYVFHRSRLSTYDPHLQGAIASIDFAIDSKQLDLPFPTSSGHGFSIALRQNGSVYFVAAPLIAQETEWTHKSATALNAESFTSFDAQGHPDFSQSGLPIEFGFRTANCNLGSTPYTITDGYDNWSVTLHAPRTGRVLFEDAVTPVRVAAGPRVSVIARSRTDGARHAVDASDDGSYYLPQLAPGDYDIVARYELPLRYIYSYPRWPRVVWQPFDLSTSPDLTVSADGTINPCPMDILFPWPAILLHGRIGGSNPGPSQMTDLAAWLAIARPRDLSTSPRFGIIPIAPDMGSGNYYSFENALEANHLSAITGLFPSQTRLRVLGYSQGGLVARILLESSTVLPPARIERVVQAGTPNHGSCLASFYPGTGLTESDLDSFNSVWTHSYGVPFFQIAGAGSCMFPPCTFGHCNSDRVVDSDSVFFLGQVPGADYTVFEMMTLQGVTHFDSQRGLLHDPSSINEIARLLSRP